MPQPHIRRVVLTDAAGLAPLLEQLGYPATPADIAMRLARVAQNTDAAAWVATDADATPIGLVTGHVIWSYASNTPNVQLTALVVSSRSRGTGVGRQLVATIEEWARRIGAGRVDVASAQHRDDAHAFYLALGYAEAGKRFRRSLA
jgi:GNAT superfamily N-acetyltransferase